MNFPKFPKWVKIGAAIGAFAGLFPEAAGAAWELTADFWNTANVWTRRAMVAVLLWLVVIIGAWMWGLDMTTIGVVGLLPAFFLLTILFVRIRPLDLAAGYVALEHALKSLTGWSLQKGFKRTIGFFLAVIFYCMVVPISNDLRLLIPLVIAFLGIYFWENWFLRFVALATVIGITLMLLTGGVSDATKKAAEKQTNSIFAQIASAFSGGSGENDTYPGSFCAHHYCSPCGEDIISVEKADEPTEVELKKTCYLDFEIDAHLHYTVNNLDGNGITIQDPITGKAMFFRSGVPVEVGDLGRVGRNVRRFRLAGLGRTMIRID